MRSWRWVGLLPLAFTLSAAEFYVDAALGSDSNSGASPREAWKTLQKVNGGAFQPGDVIRLRAGQVWQGQLAPTSSGAAGAPIVIRSYGDGPKPRIEGAGQVTDAVSLRNVEHIEVRDLEVTNHGDKPALRRGVHIVNDNFGTAHHIVVAGLWVHDVNGIDQRKENGGIIFSADGRRVPSRFDGLVIERNIVWKVDRSGIAANNDRWVRSRWFPSLHVIIRDNLVQDVGGDGIVPWTTDHALVEHNIALDANKRSTQYNAGIWPWSTDNSVFQLNEAGRTHGTRDGQGFDSDFNSQNSLFQYNYSHDNEGGFLLICAPGNGDPSRSLGNIGTVVRYNVSRNDAARIFHVSAAENTLVHDNAIYVGQGRDVQMVITSEWSGWPKGLVFRNNKFRSDGVARYGHGVGKTEDGRYSLGPGWGPATGVAFEGNRFIGNHVDRPEDAKGKVEAAEGIVPELDAPRFDPANPEGFDEFLTRHRRWMVSMLEREFGKPVELVKAGVY